MNDPIYLELMSNVKLPNMTVDKIFMLECDSDIIRHCSTKQVIHLSSNEVKDILSKTEIPLPKFLLKFDDGLTEPDISQYEGIDDGYQVSEYFGKSDTYIPTFNYFRAVKFGGIDFIMNLYNGKDANIAIKEISSKIKNDEIDIKDIKLPFNIIENPIKYAMFTDVIYNHKTRMNKYMYTFPSLCLNLSYEYYSTQNVPENILTWNIDTNELQFANKSVNEVINMFNEICNNGLTKPLYFQISHGKIVSASDDDYIKLIIAQYLRLPTIPVVLYALNSSQKSDILISMRPCDIINSSLDIDGSDDYTLINSICDPYIIFYNQYQAQNIATENGSNDCIYKSIYRDDNYNEFYLVPDSSYSFNKSISDEFENCSVEEIHKILKDRLQDKIDEDIRNAIAELN